MTVPSPKTVVALFDNFEAAQQAVEELVEEGFTHDSISMIAPGEGAHMDRSVGDTTEEPGGVGIGAAGGGVVGGAIGLLLGLGLLAVPGIGPVLAAGPLAAAIGATALGAGIGAAAGGLLGALVGKGVPSEEAGSYVEGVRRGGTLLVVDTADMMVDRAYDILRRHGAVDMNERSEQWRRSGWTV